MKKRVKKRRKIWNKLFGKKFFVIERLGLSTAVSANFLIPKK
jgi:hypothetical protein